MSVPLPWPKPALNHDYLKPASAHVIASSVTSRLFAAEPLPGDHILVETYERDGAVARKFAWHLDAVTEIEPTIEAIAGAETGALSTVATGSQTVSGDIAPPTFLVCTQGSHDSCCGTSGVALADEIETERGHAVRRVSHTGGHRFSPTFLAFPEGRMWAFADLALVDRIVSGETTADDHRLHSRGWWGARVGPAQVAECAVRAERAALPFVAPAVEALNGADGQPATRFAVSIDDLVWHVDVSVGRAVPSIACEAPGGLPAKPGREFAWSIEREEQAAGKLGA